MRESTIKISVVTPTLRRPDEVVGMLQNLSKQTLLPHEVILVDGAPPEENETETKVQNISHLCPFEIRYIRRGGGTAIQRNIGIDEATGSMISFIDDDIRLEPDFFEQMAVGFEKDVSESVGGIAGYITNQHFAVETSSRWNWYKRLRLLTTYTPGFYDFKTGIPINRYLYPPHSSLRTIQCMGAGCAVWRKSVFDQGLRFSHFFSDYGVLEDAHLALCAGKYWVLQENGSARCEHLHSQNSRANRRRIGYKCVVNYYFVFLDICGPLSMLQKIRFWRFQTFELFRIAISALHRRRWDDVRELLGRFEGFFRVLRGL
ncbi:MAG: glycosyltransferase [Chloracidobacterium sp.]|nr:glycosyltransferase [Chloracidobacterium sp.]